MPYHGLIVVAGNGRSAPVWLYAYATSQAPPACVAFPSSDYYLSLDFSDYLNAIEEASDTNRLRIINLTSLSLWITCRAERSSCCPMFGRTGHSRWPRRFRG